MELIVDEALRYLGAGGSEDDPVPPCGAYGAHNLKHRRVGSLRVSRFAVLKPKLIFPKGPALCGSFLALRGNSP